MLDWNITEILTLKQILIALCWALFGIFGSILIERVRHKKYITRHGGFKLKVWLVNNIERTLLSIFTMLVYIIFPDFFGAGDIITNKAAFFGGFFIDKVVESLTKIKTNKKKE